MIKYDFKPAVEDNLTFGLYGYEGIDFEMTKKSILAGFKKKYEQKIKEALAKIGIKYMGLEYFSPIYYNHCNDGLTLKISNRINKKLFKKAIVKYQTDINLELSKNKSYDGYMSLTVANIAEELKRLAKPNYEPDVLVLNTIINKMVDFSEFYIFDYFVYDEVLK